MTTQRLLASTDSTVQVLDLFGRARTLSKDSIAFEPSSLRQEVERLVAARHSGATVELSSEGGITGQFEPSGPTLPELLVAAWALEQGDAAAAARTILPSLELTSSPDRLRSVAQNLMMVAYHHQMLEAFSYDWDYPRAAGYAAALQRRLFAGQPHVSVSREFELQFRSRTTDFREFALPDSAAWDSIRRSSSRRARIEYLVSRLRLLNAFQAGQPGDVSFGWPQFATPSHQRAPWTDGKPRSGPRINPLTELDAMKPTLADIPALLPGLEDRNFLPTFGFWRDFHPSRTHYQVGQLVENMINHLADQPLVSFEDYQALSSGQQSAYLDTIANWARARTGWSIDELNREVLRTSPIRNVVWFAAEKASRRRDVEAAPLIIRRRPEFSDVGTYLDKAVAGFDSVALNQAAHKTLLPAAAPEWKNASSDSGLLWQQLWAVRRVMMVEPSSSAARTTAIKALEADRTGQWGAQWAASLIPTDSGALTRVICGQLEKPGFMKGVISDEQIFVRLIDGGCNAALEHYLWIHFLREVEFLKRRANSDSVQAWLRDMDRNRREQLARRAQQWPEAPLIDPQARWPIFVEQVQTFRTWLSEYCLARGQR